MRVSLVLAVAVAVMAAAALAADGRSAVAPYIIHADRSFGGVKIARSKPAAAIATFGAPATKKAEGQSCRMHWPQLRLVVRFLDFEGQPCTNGVPVVATITSRGHWRTAVGLRIGDPIARLWQLYPHASLQTGPSRPPEQVGYWLVTRHACAEVGGAAYPGLLARARNGRVAALVLSTSACE